MIRLWEFYRLEKIRDFSAKRQQISNKIKEKIAGTLKLSPAKKNSVKSAKCAPRLILSSQDACTGKIICAIASCFAGRDWNSCRVSLTRTASQHNWWTTIFCKIRNLYKFKILKIFAICSTKIYLFAVKII